MKTHRSFAHLHAWILSVVFLPLAGVALLLCGCEGERPDASFNGPATDITSGKAHFEVRAERGEISLAESLRLSLTLIAPEVDKASLPQPTGSLGEWEVVDSGSVSRSLVDDRIRYQRILTLRPFLPGKYRIPVLVAGVTPDEGGQARELRNAPFTINVTGLEEAASAKATLRDLAPPLSEPMVLWPWLLAAALLITAIAAYFFWPRKEIPVVIPPRPAHEIADEALAELLAEKLLERGMVEVFFVRLSDILRHYLENRFGLRAPEQTTEEFLRIAHGHGALNAPQRNLIQDFLRRCDLVKFARYAPPREEVDGALSACRRLIDETRASAVPTDSAGDQAEAQ